LIPAKSGDWIKTDPSDAMMLAKLHRAAELTAICIYDAAHEAIRDLVWARATVGRVLSKAGNCKAFWCAMIGSIAGLVPDPARRRCLTTVRFDHPAQQIAPQHLCRRARRSQTRPAETGRLRKYRRAG
jgi:transposase